MRKTLSIALFILLSFALSAQEKAVYRITYDCDAQYSKSRATYRWNLDIGGTTAVFYSPNYRLYNNELNNFDKSVDLATIMSGIQGIGGKYPNRNSLEVMTGAPDLGKYTYVNTLGVDKLYYEEELPEIAWELIDSVRTVCGYECHQARAEVYGRLWTVWYSPELPLSYGPYVLGGLPGLILGASDSEGIFRFEAVGIETAPQDAKVELFSKDEAVKCTRSRYLGLRKAGEGRTYSEIANNVLNSGVSVAKITDASGKEITDQVMPTKNYLDLK